MTTFIVADVTNIARRTDPDSVVADIEYPMLAAHRGGLALYPENTLDAFDQVTETHPDIALEMDVQALKDGTLVVWHDATVDKLSANGYTGSLANLTMAQWRGLKVKHPKGGPAAPAVTFKQVLDAYGGESNPLLVELKTPAAADAFIEAVWPYREQIIVQSFDTKIVSRFVRSGLHTLQLSSDTAPAMVDGIHSLGIRNTAITKATCDRAHDAGVKVWAWGDDVTPGMLDTDKRGVDGFMVDNPDL